MKAKHVSKVQRADIITTLPQGIVETILCLLPIEEAARTSVLSREWRYKWTTVPKLEFCQSEETLSSDLRQYMRCKLFYAIHQVLLLHQGPIHEFELTMDVDHTYFEIDQIILHLSRNHTVKKLTFDFFDGSSYGLPLSFFSLHHLTELCIENCDLNHKPIFSGFDSLTSLSMTCVKISRESLLHLLSNCPSLKRLKLIMVKSDFIGHVYPSIMELFKCLPVIEHLTTWGILVPHLVNASVLEELPISLIHLKYFCFEHMSFAHNHDLTFLAVLIKCSPNLEKIELQVDGIYAEIGPHKFEEYSIILEGVWLEHLIELKIDDFSNSKPELEFVNFILARSPNLKKVRLQTFWKKIMKQRYLLRAPHASPVEIIYFENH